MGKIKKISGGIALFSGLISILLIIAPSIGFKEVLGRTKDTVLSLLFGSMGLVISKIQSKPLVDKATKVALWCSLTGIILATIKGIFILTG